MQLESFEFKNKRFVGKTDVVCVCVCVCVRAHSRVVHGWQVMKESESHNKC